MLVSTLSTVCYKREQWSRLSGMYESDCYPVIKNPLSPVEHPGGVGVNCELFELGVEQFVVSNTGLLPCIAPVLIRAHTDGVSSDLSQKALLQDSRLRAGSRMPDARADILLRLYWSESLNFLRRTYASIERLHHRILIGRVDRTRTHPFTQAKNALHDTKLGSSCI